MVVEIGGPLPDAGERTLAVGERQFQIIIEASPVAYALNDEHQNITYLNAEFVRTFGYTRADIPTLADWWPRAYPEPAYRRWVIAEWARRLEVARSAGASFEPMELTIRAKDGGVRTVVAYAAPLEEAFTGAHLVVLYDITALREAEAAQRRLHDELAHAQRVESLGRLAGGVAHDNNNMLAVILGSVEFALRHAPEGHVLHDQLMMIRGAAERSSTLMRQLLAYARKQATAPRVVALGAEVTDTLRMVRPLVGSEVRITCELGAELWSVRVDPTQLRQVITNLMLNASDALDGAGAIAVVVANVAGDALTTVLPPDAARTDYVRLTVTDTGRGMSAEVAARAFEPFFTTKAEGKGTGLGLSTAYGIARQSGGFLTLHSTVGTGSTFACYLPRCREARGAASAGAGAGAGTDRTGRGDDPGRRRRAGAARAAAALPRGAELPGARGERPGRGRAAGDGRRRRLQLLLTDIVMPGGNGLALARALAAQRPALHVLLMSGFAANVDPGSIPLIEKPFRLEALEARIRALLAGARHRSP